MLNHPAVLAFPEMAIGSACATSFSRLAQCSLTLRPAHSRCHQFAARFTGGFNRLVTSTVAPVASGWSRLPGGTFTHWESAALTRRTPEAAVLIGPKWAASEAIR